MLGLDRIFDRAKGLAIAAGAATLLAIAGVATLAISAAMTLQLRLPGSAAYAVTGVALLAVATIAMWVGMHPKKPEKTETAPPKVDPAKAVLDMIDLSVGVATQIVKTRPVATTLAVAGLGFLAAWKPKAALSVADSLLSRIVR